MAVEMLNTSLLLKWSIQVSKTLLLLMYSASQNPVITNGI